MNNSQVALDSDPISCMIITVMNQKGGSAKTTTCVNLAGAFKKAGYRVAIVDLDPQVSVTFWKSIEQEEGLFPCEAYTLAMKKAVFEPDAARNHSRRIRGEMQSLAKMYDVLVLDTSAAVGDPAVPAALALSDFALIPVRPGALDIGSTLESWQVAELACASNPDLVSRVVLVDVDRNSAAEQVRETVKRHPAWAHAVARSEIDHRAAFAKAALLGGTVYATDNGAAKGQMDLLMAEIVELIKAQREAAQ
jgi:chromosome partitioning protein